jgi:TfoX/Sxy family transcriptional regulator of competence genes
MTYDEHLAERIRELLATTAAVDEKRMFGGLAFLVNGNMAVCASREGGLMVRVPAEDTAGLLTRAHVEPMVMAGRETRGWIRVGAAGIGSRRELQAWVERGTQHAASLPPKAKKPRRA